MLFQVVFKFRFLFLHAGSLVHCGYDERKFGTCRYDRSGVAVSSVHMLPIVGSKLCSMVCVLRAGMHPFLSSSRYHVFFRLLLTS